MGLILIEPIGRFISKRYDIDSHSQQYDICQYLKKLYHMFTIQFDLFGEQKVMRCMAVTAI